MLRAPYNNAMRLGQGFNSFTQQLCIIDAVGVGDDRDEQPRPQRDTLDVSQIATYSSRFVDKVSNVTSKCAFPRVQSFNYNDHCRRNECLGSAVDQGIGFLGGKYVDTDKFKESDLNFFIQVSVTNQEHMQRDYSEFQWIEGLPTTKFNKVYSVRYVNLLGPQTQLIKNHRTHSSQAGKKAASSTLCCPFV